MMEPHLAKQSFPSSLQVSNLTTSVMNNLRSPPPTEEYIRKIRLHPHVFEERVRNLFNTIDKNQNGSLSREELLEYFETHKVLMNRIDFDQFIQRYDADGSGHLCFSEFLEFMKQQDEHLRSIFRSFDCDRSGSISRENVIEALRREGVTVCPDEIESIMNQLDTNKDGEVSYQEWYDFLHSHQFHGPLFGHTRLDIWNHIRERRSSSIILDTMLPEDDFDDDASQIFHTFNHPKWLYMIGGAFACATSRSIVSPLDVLVTQMQMQKLQGTAGNAKPRFASSLSELIAQKGIRGLYRGNLITIARAAPEVAMRNFLYEHSKHQLLQYNLANGESPALSWHQRFLACNISACATQVILYPLDYIKTSLQTAGRDNLKFTDVLKKTIRSQRGIRGLYAGLCPSVIRVAGEISTYETFKAVHLNQDPLRYPTVTASLVMGSIACAVSQTLTYPLFYARTLLQGQNICSVVKAAPAKYTGTLDAISKIYRTEGIKGLYRGWRVNLARTVPAVSANFVMYELAKSRMGIN